MTLPYAEPYKIKMTEAIRTSTRAEREAWIREARYNLFKLRSDQVTIDLLTDSGTGSMSDRQWAAMMTGDESYAGASSYFRLKETIESIFGMPYFLPTHQGRAAENVIFSALLKAGDIVPGNSHFDTTKGHIEFRRCHAVDCTIDDAADTQKELPFKGEMDIAKLEKLLRENPREKVPCVVLTITNNTAGGQPVSMRPKSAAAMAYPCCSTRPASPRMPISSRPARRAMPTRPSRRSSAKSTPMPTS